MLSCLSMLLFYLVIVLLCGFSSSLFYVGSWSGLVLFLLNVYFYLVVACVVFYFVPLPHQGFEDDVSQMRELIVRIASILFFWSCLVLCCVFCVLCVVFCCHWSSFVQSSFVGCIVLRMSVLV
jgi:hypothetical protein